MHVTNHEIVCKVVYYGPARSGKTANLVNIYERTPGARRGKLSSVVCDGGLDSFESTEFRLGALGNYQLRLRVHTAPMSEAARANHDHLLQDADGIVFVADGDPRRLPKNVEALALLKQTLEDQGRDLDSIPLVFQWNKRDLQTPTPVARMAALLNEASRTSVESVVPEGLGVISAFRLLTEQVLTAATREVSPFVDEDLAIREAHTCARRLTALVSPMRPITRTFKRPATTQTPRPQAAPSQPAPEPTPEPAPATPSFRSSSRFRVVGTTRKTHRPRRPSRRRSRGVAALIVMAAAAVGGLLGSQDAFQSLASSVADAVHQRR